MVEPKTGSDDKTKTKMSEPGIGLKRIRTIMKSTADTGHITQEGLFIMTKATEYFIQHIAKSAFENSKNNSLNYEHLSNMIDDEDKYEFLLQIIPKKITVREFKEILARKTEKSDTSSEDDDDEEESSNKKSKSK